jgi:hypothetical protein
VLLAGRVTDEIFFSVGRSDFLAISRRIGRWIDRSAGDAKNNGASPLVNIEQGTARSTSLKAVEVFDAGAGIENDDPLPAVDLAGRAQSF